MTKLAHVVGIDPGLVHTGCVRMVFDCRIQCITLGHAVVDGLDIDTTVAWVKDTDSLPHPFVFIEAYRPRHNLAPDTRMTTGVAGLKSMLPGAVVLPNTGVTRVVPASLMSLLHVLDWPQSTHHQDLRSAARIALLGMMKDATLNAVLSTTVRDHLEGRTWQVIR